MLIEYQQNTTMMRITKILIESRQDTSKYHQNTKREPAECKYAAKPKAQMRYFVVFALKPTRKRPS